MADKAVLAKVDAKFKERYPDDNLIEDGVVNFEISTLQIKRFSGC